MPEPERPDDDSPPAQCYVCHATLQDVGTLIGCYHCARVLMCKSHIGGIVTVDGGPRALCCICLRLPAQ